MNAAKGRLTPRPALSRRIEARVKDGLLSAALKILPPRDGAPALAPGQAHRILVVRQDQRLGNLLLMTPFLQALRRAAPQAEIALLLGDRFAELFEHAPWVDHVIVERKRWLIRHPGAYPAHIRGVGRGRWDLAFELSNPDTHSFNNVFLTIASRAPARIGFDHPRSRPALSALVAPPREECHYSLAPLLLLSALGVAPETPPLRVPDALGAAPGEAPGEIGIVIHPGGRGAKRWPVERFRDLARALGDETRMPITVIAGPADAALAAAVAARAPSRARPLILRSLSALAGVLRRAALYIGCDTGPAHLAAALRLPGVVLFLESHPLRYAPLGAAPTAILLGARSRALAQAPALAPPRTRAPQARAEHGPLLLQPDPAYASSLTRQRPRLSIPPGGLSASAELAFVRDQVLRVWAERQSAERKIP